MPSYKPTVVYTPAEHNNAAIMIGVGTSLRCCRTCVEVDLFDAMDQHPRGDGGDRQPYQRQKPSENLLRNFGHPLGPIMIGHFMSLFANLVAVSQRVGATTARLAKVRELAACLRAVEPSEIDTAVHYLSGEIPQGRFGIGYAILRKASEQSGVAATATLTIGDVDREPGGRRCAARLGLRDQACRGAAGPCLRAPRATSRNS